MIISKSPYDVAVALVIVVINSLAAGMTFWGTFRRLLNATDETWVTSDHLVLGGNILQAFALIGTLYFLSKTDGGIVTGVLGISMIILLVVVIYLTQIFTTPGQNSDVHISVLVILAIDLLVKTYSLLFGFGVCTVGDIGNMVGGRRGFKLFGKTKLF